MSPPRSLSVAAKRVRRPREQGAYAPPLDFRLRLCGSGWSRFVSGAVGEAEKHPPHGYPGGGNGLMRIRPGSTTEKWPAQSARLAIAAQTCAASWAEVPACNRNSTIPQPVGNPAWNAKSPKSLSKVRRIRCSATARDRTCGSVLAGASVRTQATSWPRARNASTASSGKFSFAKKFTRHQ